jgi:hypothetical protein
MSNVYRPNGNRILAGLPMRWVITSAALPYRPLADYGLR